MAVGVDPVVQYAYTLNNTSESDHALIPISRTEKYFFSCYAKGSASSEFSISVRQYNSSGTYLSTLELLVDGPLTSSYVKKSYQFGNGVTGLGFNSSCTQIQLELYEGANETNVDDVRISREMTADSITAGILTGRTVQTASSGERIVINTDSTVSTGENSILFYDGVRSDPVFCVTSALGENEDTYGVAIYKGSLKISNNIFPVAANPLPQQASLPSYTVKTLNYDGGNDTNSTGNWDGGSILYVGNATHSGFAESASIYDVLDV